MKAAQSSTPLAIIFSEPAHARSHAALTLACSSAALGRRVHLFFHGEAVTILEPHRRWRGDETLAAVGISGLSELLGSARDLGVAMMACPSGLHLCGITANLLPDGVETGGMMAFLASAPGAQIIVV